jgi:malate dehydrogenase (quinone)
MINGADVNYGALTKNLIDVLHKHDDFKVHFREAVTDLSRRPDGGWQVVVKNETTGVERTIATRFVFLGAGGAALTLLQKSGIPESHGYAGFPVSGLWMRCDKPEVVNRHSAKVYGKAATGSPPMSVPHLDTRIIDGKRWLLFGPYAGFSTKFLKNGSYCDLPRSLRLANLLPMLSVAKDNFPLEEYLLGQLLQTNGHRFKALREYYPTMNEADWQRAVAGQRVQIIKKEKHFAGQLGVE